MFLYVTFVSILLVTTYGAQAQKTEGDLCTLKNGDTGVCTVISQCTPAVMLGRLGMRPVICSFQSRTPIVCCGESLNTQLYYATSSTTSRPQRRPSSYSGNNQNSRAPNNQQQYSNENSRPPSSNNNQQYPNNRPSSSNNNQQYPNDRPLSSNNNNQQYPNNGPLSSNNNNQQYPNNGPSSSNNNNQQYPNNRPLSSNNNNQQYPNNRPSSSNNNNQQYPNNRPSSSNNNNQQYPNNRPSSSNNNQQYPNNRPSSSNNNQEYPNGNNRPSSDNNNRYPNENTRPFRPSSGSYNTERPTMLLPVKPEGDRESSSNRRRISEIKCAEYSKLVTDVVEAIPLIPNAQSVALEVQKCDLASLQLIVGGNKTEPGEFPHMAAIGFENSRGDLEWKCGGSLISELYVLTAAHCTYTGLGPPVVVRLGEYNLRTSYDGAHPVDFRVAKIIRHPDYKPPARYNDIALLKLHKPVQFSKYIRPACLYTEPRIENKKAVATGWGNIDYAESPSDILLKVPLSIVDNNLCNNLYQSDSRSNHLSRGIIPSMLCAGELAGGKDTCQGDSGGPLQVTRQNNQCVYYIIGVTSFGKYCAAKNAPGVYTRVSYFVPWIESVVWL